MTRITSLDGVKTCTTYVAVHSSSDLPEEERGKTIWMWDEELSGGVMSSSPVKHKKSAVVGPLS